MARKIEVLKIDDREVEVKELKWKEFLSIIELLEGKKDIDNKGTIHQMQEMADIFLPKACNNLTSEELLDITPRETKMIWNKFIDLNKDFFEMTGLDKAIKGLNLSPTKPLSR